MIKDSHKDPTLRRKINNFIKKINKKVFYGREVKPICENNQTKFQDSNLGF